MGLGSWGFFDGPGCNDLVGQPESRARATAWFAAAIYGLNPNLLYLQATAMTESLYLALFLWRWCTFVILGEDARKPGTGGRWRPTIALEMPPLPGRRVSHALRRMVRRSCARRLSRVEARGGRQPASPEGGPDVCAFGRVGSLLVVCLQRDCLSNPLEFATGPIREGDRTEDRRAGFPPHPGTGNLSVAASYFVKAGEFSIGEGNWQRAWLLLALLGSALVAWRNRRMAALLLLWLPCRFTCWRWRMGAADLHAGVVAAIPLQHPVWRAVAAGARSLSGNLCYYLVSLPGAQLPNRAWPC